MAGACCDTQKKQNLSELVEHLYRKTKEHFKYEEAAMQEAGYPGFVAHRREHIMLLAELKLAINKADSDMVRELKTWFMAHIKHSDCRFSAYISRRKMATKINLISPEKTLDL